MKSATKKLSAEITDTLIEKFISVSVESKKIKKSIEKAAAKLAKKVSKFEKETAKKKAKEVKDALKKDKGKNKAEKVASLVVAASKSALQPEPTIPTTGKASKSTPKKSETEAPATEVTQ